MSVIPFLNRVNVGMKQPELLSVILARGQNEVMSRQTQSSLHSGHEGSVEDHPIRTRGFDQLSKLHDILRGTRNLGESNGACNSDEYCNAFAIHSLRLRLLLLLLLLLFCVV